MQYRLSSGVFRFFQDLRNAMLFALLATSILAAWADSPGRNGARTVSAAGTVVNQYTTLASAAAVGATSITVASAAALSSAEAIGGGALAAGDVILIYQARGATIDSSNTTGYGAVTAYGSAGNYEMRTVRSVAGNVISLESDSSGASCTLGLKQAYANGAQVVRVPQYSALTVDAAASVVPTAWNGSTGGVVAMLVQNTATVNGSVTASGFGFRGGVLDGTDRVTTDFATIFFATDSAPAGGQKGEGIASGPGATAGGLGLAYTNPGGNFDMAAPANGGGGGGSHNGGGGGGANAALALTPYCTTGASTYSSSTSTTTLWCGQGVMPAGITGAAAWDLDPATLADGARTAHVGGGRGGYTYSGANLNALTVGPGTSTWTGNSRRSLGGWGGRPLTQNLSQKVFFGGGGGAGGANSGPVGGSGGAGGGMVLLIAGTVTGSGALAANGAAGGSTTGTGNDGPGGGGAGGTVLVHAGSVSGISMAAIGGAGGIQTIASAEAEGPGGGGGGGILAVTGGAPTRIASGGAGGTTNSTALTEFPRNGATDGSPGNTTASAPDLLGSYRPCTALGVNKDNGVTSLVAGTNTVYTLTVTNSGPGTADNTVLTDPARPGIACSALACSAFSGASCPGGASTTVAYLQGPGVVVPLLPPGSSVTFALSCGVTATGQ